MEGEYPYIENLLTMVINHLLTGMILQVGILLQQHLSQVERAVSYYIDEANGFFYIVMVGETVGNVVAGVSRKMWYFET